MKQRQEKNKLGLKHIPNKPNPGTIKFQILVELVLLTKGLTGKANCIPRRGVWPARRHM